MPSDDVESNVIDLQARLAQMRAGVVADHAAVATAELHGLRNSLRNLNLIIELNDVTGSPVLDDKDVHRALDQITAELLHYMLILKIPSGVR